MSNRFTLTAVTCACLALALPAFAQETAPTSEPDASTVVATVNGTEITIGHMLIARTTLPQQFQQLPDEVLFQGILDQLVQQTVLQQSFDGALPQRIKTQLENEQRSLIAGEVIEGILQNALTEEAILEIFNSDFADAEPGQEYNAAHILLETEEEALAVKAELDGGADFADTARKKSTGPSGPSGGSLGWFGSGAMVPDFEAAVVALDVGAVSEPVQTQFGWHVIKLNETRAKAAPTLEEVRPEIEARVRNEAVEAQVKALTEAATIDRSGFEGLDPALISNFELIE